MNTIKNTVSGISLLLLMSQTTLAADVPANVMPTGSLNITGQILDKGCTFEVKDVVLQLPPAATKNFTALGDLGPMSNSVNFNLTECPPNSPLKFTVAGTAGNTTSSFELPANGTNATGFDILLHGPDAGNLIVPNTEKILTTDASGNYSGTLSAQLVRWSSATPVYGVVDVTYTYTLAYN